MIAIVQAVSHFRCYLLGKHFKIYTDHKPLQGALKTCNISKRLILLQNKLIEYDYKIIYKPGRLNCNADALSRIEFDEDIPLINITTKATTRKEKEKDISTQNSKTGSTQGLEQVVEESSSTTIQNAIEETSEKSLIEQNRFASSKEITNPIEKQAILKEFHNSPLSGHQGVDKTVDRIKRQLV